MNHRMLTFVLTSLVFSKALALSMTDLQSDRLCRHDKLRGAAVVENAKSEDTDGTARGRNLWIKKCMRDTYNILYPLTEYQQYADQAGHRKLKYASFQTYEVDQKGNSFLMSWKAPTSVDADCETPDNLVVGAVCVTNEF